MQLYVGLRKLGCGEAVPVVVDIEEDVGWNILHMEVSLVKMQVD
jgi:hypothetical protein